MANILSLQSHVAYGYVGNRAATFPIQRLGHEVISINTVQFSNHTGYGSWRGDVMSLEHIEAIFAGLAERGALNNLDAILTGYLGDKALGEVLLKWLTYARTLNPNLIYCCDPVIGDVGRGVFVRPGVPEFFRDKAVHEATILTPNQFELSMLTGIAIETLIDIKAACRKLHDSGVKYILVTSLIHSETLPNEIGMLLSTPATAYLITTPRLKMPIEPNGSGDMTAAIFLAKFLESRDIIHSLEHTAGAVYAIFEKTLELGRRELAIIQAQEELVYSRHKFPITRV